MKATSDNKPEVIQSLGNGSYNFNYNITEIEQGYSYEYITVWEPSRSKIVKAIIREWIDESQELNLINKFNAYNLGLSTDEADKTNYENYLKELSRIKELVTNSLTPKNDEESTEEA